MIKALIFDFYGVIYSNFDWNVIDARVYPYEDRAKEFVSLKRLANKGDISNTDFLSAVAKLAKDESAGDH